MFDSSGFSSKKFRCLICGRSVCESDFKEVCLDSMCPACRTYFIKFRNRIRDKISLKQYRLTKNGKYWIKNPAFNIIKKDNKGSIYPFKSRLEKQALSIIRQNLLFNDVEINAYHEWLINPKTGHELTLDFFFPEFDLAIEIDGYRHFSDSGMSSNWSFDDYMGISERDRLKDKICKKKGVKLLRFSDVEITREIISKKLRELNLMARQKTD